MQRQQRPLSPKIAVGYSAGDFGLNFYWSGVSYFLLYWYTDVVGLPAQTAGLLFLLGSLWDALADPTVGFFADRFNSRHGRYRPWLAFGAVPLAGSFALLFFAPPLSGMPLLISLFLAHILFRSCYSVVAVPYSSLSTRLSHSSNDRTLLSGTRMVAAYAGGLLITTVWFPLSALLGNGSERSGFFRLALLAGTIAIGFHIACFLATKEQPTSHKLNKAVLDRRVFFHYLTNNRALLVMLIAIPFFSAASVFVGKNLVYYTKYGLTAHLEQYRVLFWHGLVTVCAAPIWTMIATRIGQRNSWGLAVTIVVPTALIVFLVPTKNVLVFLALWTPMAFGLAAVGVLFWAMLPDAVNYGQWKTGHSYEASVFGVATVAQKVSIGFSGWAVGLILSAVSFDPGLPQSTSTTTAIKAMMTLAPAALLLLSWLALRRYPISRKLQDQIQSDLHSTKGE